MLLNTDVQEVEPQTWNKDGCKYSETEWNRRLSSFENYKIL